MAGNTKGLGFYLKRALRVLQKGPGINLVEYIEAGSVCYVINPKAGSRTIVHSLTGWKTGHWGHDEAFYWSHVSIAPYWWFRRQTKGALYFTVLRDAEDRLRSCWNDKLVLPEHRGGRIGQQYFVFYYPLLRFGMSYEAFRAAIALIPDALAEKHFMSQEHLLRLNRIPYAEVFALEQLHDCEAWLRGHLDGFEMSGPLNKRQ